MRFERTKKRQRNARVWCGAARAVREVVENAAQAVDVHRGEVGDVPLQRDLGRHWSKAKCEQRHTTSESLGHALYAIVPLVTALVSWLNALMPKLMGGNRVSTVTDVQISTQNKTNKVHTQPPSNALANLGRHQTV